MIKIPDRLSFMKPHDFESIDLVKERIKYYKIFGEISNVKLP